MSTMTARWAARKTDEELLTAIVRIDAIHDALAYPEGNRPIYDALVAEARARGLYCDGCGEKPVTTATEDGSWMGCEDCATAPTHP